MKGISGAVVIRGNSNRMKENAQKKKKNREWHECNRRKRLGKEKSSVTTAKTAQLRVLTSHAAQRRRRTNKRKRADGTHTKHHTASLTSLNLTAENGASQTSSRVKCLSCVFFFFEIKEKKKEESDYFYFVLKG